MVTPKWAVDLAKIMKETAKGSSQFYDGFVIGKVVEKPPSIKISIHEAIILDESYLIVAASITDKYERKIHYEQTNGVSTGVASFVDTLQVGDYVILIPAGNFQMFVLLDKVGSF